MHADAGVNWDHICDVGAVVTDRPGPAGWYYVEFQVTDERGEIGWYAAASYGHSTADLRFTFYRCYENAALAAQEMSRSTATPRTRVARVQPPKGDKMRKLCKTCGKWFDSDSEWCADCRQDAAAQRAADPSAGWIAEKDPWTVHTSWRICAPDTSPGAQPGDKDMVAGGLTGGNARKIVAAVNGHTLLEAATRHLFNLLDSENGTHSPGCTKAPASPEDECCARRGAWDRVWAAIRYL